MMKKTNNTIQKLSTQYIQKRAFSTGNAMNRLTSHGTIQLPYIVNEPMKTYAKGSPERSAVLSECEKYLNVPKDSILQIPTIINGKRYYQNDEDLTFLREMPSLRSQYLFRAHGANKDMIREAIEGSLKAKKEWEDMPLEYKCSVFLKAADLLSSPDWRYKINAATMMGQGKTMYQAEIDSSAELIDFLRFNAFYASKLIGRQVDHHNAGTWNRVEYRALEGFVAAISPFNFTAIGGNLACAPAQMGNVVLWKPSDTAVLSNYVIYQVLEAAGLPPGVIQFVPTKKASDFGETVLNDPNFTGLHFTGSTKTFQTLYNEISNKLNTYKSIPRIVGETGGKNFHFMHPDCDVTTFVNQTLRGSFEYSGQKCSATSRCYIPKSKFAEVKQALIEETKKLKVGQPNDPKSFTSAVIDEKSFDKIVGFIERARNSPKSKIIVGGNHSKEVGYFVDPTIIETTDPVSETMSQEIFGPVLTIYAYDDSTQTFLDDVLRLIDTTSSYGLTGAIFARDRNVIAKCVEGLRHSAGNFYINDKSTGAIVGQQPFGGSRVSGTNDKAGSENMLLRWTSVRAIKETFVPLKHWGYPSIDLE
ncbi:hypothetical protein C9374_012694 [Naegleria lovaniensis]|uniref:Multifunctional fusion protein n=1 Tax=Naegleria lovaniensis TaxID=51637 RepID=A0AA88H3K8_NAELO|nr:uncharacterized protein C9374_012694 [Naegleria lovaniensis]KAG2392442.1 hypothetical protein C9374_012694 [Naegleria lovaniensis]